MRLILLVLLAGSIVIHTLTSCFFGGDDGPSLSSSSVAETPNSSSSKISSSSSSSIDCSIVSSSSNTDEDLCSDFDPSTEIEHYGKMKKQFCDERDGKRYVYVQIGEQIWMAENLNFVVCSSKCGGTDGLLKDTNTENCDKFGRLYDWPTALIICPNGWHLPSDAEWTILTDYVGGDSIAGIKLRTVGGDWDCKNNARLLKRNYLMTDMRCAGSYKEGTDYYGFSALPGGSGRSESGNFYGSYEGYWWSDTKFQGIIYYRSMYYDFGNVNRSYTGETSFYSVRCVRNAYNEIIKMRW